MTTEQLRIFVVEDEALLALDLEDILSDLGHDVVGLAGSVRQALAFIEASDPLPDAAILDANLGGQSARPIADALSAREVYVVVASGYGPDELARLGFASPSINKPYSVEDLRSALLQAQ
jgi:CheY-like chemotaxis protein